MSRKYSRAGVLLALLMATGCASVTQTLSTQLKHPDGTVETRETKNSILAWWDAKNEMERLRVSSGKTHSIGITAFEQEATSTNIVLSVQALSAIIQGLRPTP